MAVKRTDKGVAGKGTGEIFRVAGPVVTATGLRPRMYDVQFVGEEQLLGEVIQPRSRKGRSRSTRSSSSWTTESR